MFGKESFGAGKHVFRFSEKKGSSVIVRQQFVGYSGLQVKIKSKRHEMPSGIPKFSDLSLYLFWTVGSIV